MLTTRQGLNSASIEKLIAQCVADAMATYEAIRNSRNGANNETSGSARGVDHTVRSCSYKEFLACKTHNLKGTKGAVGLTCWFEKMVSVFHICNYTENCHELALLCPTMVTPKYKMIKMYIWGLIDDIQENFTSSKPKRIREAIYMAHDLMDQVVRSKAAKSGENKRKWETTKGATMANKTSDKRL
ncbi:hypothetical protein Tco_1487459 [Tanacetum coccineum]